MLVSQYASKNVNSEKVTSENVTSQNLKWNNIVMTYKLVEPFF